MLIKGQVRRDKLISAGNIVGVPTNSQLKIQFPLARRNCWVAAENKGSSLSWLCFSGKTVTRLLSDTQPESVICTVLHCLLRS